MTTRLFVNVYEAGRVYGGPEEGGWWFDTGTPLASVPVELTEDEWERAREAFGVELGLLTDRDYWCREEEWGAWLDDVLRAKAWAVHDEWEGRYAPTGRRGSVLGGEDYFVAVEEHFARAFPEEAPRYE